MPSVLDAQPDVRLAKVRQAVDTFDSYEVRRELQLALLVSEPPTESPEQTKALLMDLAGPLRMQTGLDAHVVGAAAAWSFHQHGIVVYERE